MCPTHSLGVPHYFCGMNCVYSVVVLRPVRAYIYREGQIPSKVFIIACILLWLCVGKSVGRELKEGVYRGFW